MRPTQKNRRLRCLRQVDRYMVLAVLGVIFFVLLMNSLASSIEHNIVAAAKAQSAQAAATSSDATSSPVTSMRINTRTVGEQGLQHVRDVMHTLWPHLARFPGAQVGVADLAYVLGSAMLPGLSPQATDAHLMELAVRSEDVPTLMALAAVVSLADGKTETLRTLRVELARRATATNTETGGFADMLAAHVAQGRTDWPVEADAHMLREYGTATARMNGRRPDLAEDVDLYEALLVAWTMGGRQNGALLSAYQLGVEALVLERVRTQASTNLTIVAEPAPLGGAAQLFPAPAQRMCRVAALLARGVRAGAHPVKLTAPSTGLGMTHSVRLGDQAVLDVAESLASSCAARTWHGVALGAVYVDPHSSHVYAKQPTASASVSVPGVSGLPGHCAQSAAEVMRMYYELYRVTKDALYAVWALRAFSASQAACQPSAETLSTHTSTAVAAFMDEFRYFSYLMHAVYCAQHLPVRQEKALCAMHAKTERWGGDGQYMIVVPAV